MAKKKMGMASRNQTTAGKIFDVANYLFLALLGVLMLAPLIYVLVGSFSSTGLARLKFGHFSIEAYKMIFSGRMLTALFNSTVITLGGTLLNIVVTSMAAYVLSKRLLPGRKWMLRIVIFFMLFSAGMIPDFVVVNNKLGLGNSFWALWLPVTISSANLIIMKNFFQDLPESIEESARIDGCNDIQSFIKIIIPMSKASIATFSLFYAVGHWNNYLRPLIYINKPELWPITVWLRQIVLLSQGTMGDDVVTEVAAWAPSDAVKYATIVLATVPIICVYPFLQKHFAKGVTMGSVKG
jgi:ABC-type sugar transport system, permease component